MKRSGGTLAIGFFFLVLVVIPPALAAGSDILRIGSRRELFVDRFLVEKLQGVRFQLHNPRPAEKAVTLDRPWEKSINNGVSVIKDESRFLLYYSAGNRLAVAESQNGVHWNKPRLGLIEFDGDRNNNLVATATGKLMIEDTKPLPEVFLDTRPGVPPSKRFKAFTLIERSGNTSVVAWVSEDGFSFRKLQKDPIIRTSLYGAFDGLESMFWSHAEQQYVLYLR